MRRFLTSASAMLVLVAAACSDTSAPTAPTTRLSQATAPTGKYIVVLRQGVQDVPGTARRLLAARGGTLGHVYEHALAGFSVRGLPDAALAAMRADPAVAYVEPDAPAQLFGTQSGATWGIDRIDQGDLPLSGTYVYNATGTGVNAYIFDTGINKAHTEFGGRAQYVPGGTNGDFVNDGHGDASDCHGHGTHVAGTIGGTTWGVAKNVALWAARVVNCQGSGDVSMAIAAVDWCAANCVHPAVVNMSLGYGDVQSLRDAVESSIASGVTYAVAAGNGNFLGIPQDACLQSPAGAPDALTVGATDNTDKEASFSNYGTCVDILAPGVNITSADYSTTSGSTVMSGTSMATPHVAGSAALYLETNPAATPADVAAALKSNGVQGTITLGSSSSTYGTPNLFLYTGFIGGGSPPPPPPPADVITLATRGYRSAGKNRVDLTWSGSTATNVDVLRNGTRVTTTANDGAYTDNLQKKTGTFTYQVCNAGTTVCSNSASVTF